MWQKAQPYCIKVLVGRGRDWQSRQKVRRKMQREGSEEGINSKTYLKNGTNPWLATKLCVCV